MWLSLLGKVMVTLSPIFTSDSWSAARAIVTTRLVEVAVSTVAPLVPGSHSRPRQRRLRSVPVL